MYQILFKVLELTVSKTDESSAHRELTECMKCKPCLQEAENIANIHEIVCVLEC